MCKHKEIENELKDRYKEFLEEIEPNSNLSFGEWLEGFQYTQAYKNILEV